MNRKRNLPLLLTAVIVVLAIAVATARFTAPGHGTFSVRVTDPAGEAVAYADLYLYCFQTGNIEKTFSSDREGRGSVTYRPAFSRAELNDRLLDQGLTRSAPHLGVAGELGVTFRTSDQTRVTYTPRSGSRLRLYDGGSDGTVWHVTSAPE